MIVGSVVDAVNARGDLLEKPENYRQVSWPGRGTTITSSTRLAGRAGSRDFDNQWIHGRRETRPLDDSNH